MATRKLSEETVDRIRLNVEDWSDSRWARELNVSRITILNARQGEHAYMFYGKIAPRFVAAHLILK